MPRSRSVEVGSDSGAADELEITLKGEEGNGFNIPNVWPALHSYN